MACCAPHAGHLSAGSLRLVMKREAVRQACPEGRSTTARRIPDTSQAVRQAVPSQLVQRVAQCGRPRPVADPEVPVVSARETFPRRFRTRSGCCRDTHTAARVDTSPLAGKAQLVNRRSVHATIGDQQTELAAPGRFPEVRSRRIQRTDAGIALRGDPARQSGFDSRTPP